MLHARFAAPSQVTAVANPQLTDGAARPVPPPPPPFGTAHLH